MDNKYLQNVDGRQVYVDPITGGRKGVKRERHDLIPPRVLAALAEHYGFGAEKYADRNWELGYPISLSYAAAQRHLVDFWDRNDFDEEGQSNLIAAIFHIIAMHQFTTDGRESYAHLDDRPKCAE